MYILKADYQGKSKFEGNQITKILNNLDELKEVLTEEQTPFYDGFENLRKFKIACCGNILDPNVMAIIKELEDTVNILKDKFAVSITNKMHIITTHVPEYIEETRLSLGQTSDQIIESSHQYVNKRFMGSNYFVKNVENPSHGEKLLKGLKHINSYNATTKSIECCLIKLDFFVVL